MISQETLDEIRDQARLIDIVSEYVQLKRNGINHVGLCPFHSEKTPSFHVKETDSYYHCFGCGASGNVITFVMELEGLSFPEAVDHLASRFNIEVRRVGNDKRTGSGLEKQHSYKVNAMAQKFFRSALQSADPVVREYIAERELSDEVIIKFGVGYAPNEWRELTSKLVSRRAPEAVILGAGLARRNQRGELYDVFRGRLIFPVWIDPKRIAGFGGRIIPKFAEADEKGKTPKYLNSQETPVYHKHEILYGLPQARDAIRQTKEVYLVEGYMDVVSMYAAGVQNVVATCGTAITPAHAKRLAGLCRRVFILFDGDNAGRAAAAKSFAAFLNSGVDAGAVFLPDGDDPDTAARTHGSALSTYLSALPNEPLVHSFVHHTVRSVGNVNEITELGAASKGKVSEAVAKVLAKVENDIEKDELVREAAFQLRIGREQLLEIVKGGASTTRTSTATVADPVSDDGENDDQGTTDAAIKSVDELTNVDRALLTAIIADRKLVEKVLKHPGVVLELDPACRNFIEDLGRIVGDLDATEAQKKDRTKTMLELYGESWVALWRESFSLKKDESVSFERMYVECCRALKANQILRAQAQLEREIERTVDEHQRAALFDQKVRLSRQLKAIQAGLEAPL